MMLEPSERISAQKTANRIYLPSTNHSYFTNRASGLSFLACETEGVLPVGLKDPGLFLKQSDDSNHRIPPWLRKGLCTPALAGTAQGKHSYSTGGEQ